MSRRGVYGHLHDPVRVEAGHKAAATRHERERTIQILVRSYETRAGHLPPAEHLREIIQAVRSGRDDLGVVEELVG